MLLEFTKLIDMMETKGLKMPKHVKSRRISLLDHFWTILLKYKPLLAKMDNSGNQIAKVPFFDLI
jgi:hypothetical protein